jgi:hypothetical protein
MPVPANGRLRKKIVSAAKGTAVALLRSTGQRAKLGSLHLPIALRPDRPQPILLPPHFPDPQDRAAAEGAPPRPAPLPPDVRALRSRLAAAERRNARLRYALQRERQAAARANAISQHPQPLIDHLVADLSAAHSLDAAALRQTITSVLAAYGLRAAPVETPPPAPPAPASIPGRDRKSVALLGQQILAGQPEIGSTRYVQLALEALAQQGALTLPQLGSITGLTSPVARRRLRLTVEALCQAGVTRRAGERYSLV